MTGSYRSSDKRGARGVMVIVVGNRRRHEFKSWT